MVVVGLLAIALFIFAAISIVAGAIVSANKGDDEPMFIAFIIAWFSGVLGSISLVAFAVLAVIEVVN